MAQSRSPRSRSRQRSITPRSQSRSPHRSVTPRERQHTRTRSPTQPPLQPVRRASRGDNGGGMHSRSASRSRSPPARSTKIVVEKLTKNVTEEHLREIFGTYGLLRSVEVPLNRQFMTNRGTAYILYEQMADAEAATANMHEGQVDGAVINVSVVLPRRKFSRSPPPSRRLAAHLDRAAPRGYGAPPPRGPRYQSPPRRVGRGGRSNFDTYRRRSYSRSRSPRRSRTRSYSRSVSRSPPPRPRGGGRGGDRPSYRQRDSPPPRSRYRSPSYSSYDSYSDRGRSRSRTPPRGGRECR